MFFHSKTVMFAALLLFVQVSLSPHKEFHFTAQTLEPGVYLAPAIIKTFPGKPLECLTAGLRSSSLRKGGICTYTLPLAHLMKVGSSTDDDYLSIAWVAQVCCQLPLSRSVPAHIEEYLDDDEYDDDSVKETGKNKEGKGVMGHYVSSLIDDFYCM